MGVALNYNIMRCLIWFMKTYFYSYLDSICMYVCMYVPDGKHEVRFWGSVKEQIVASWRRAVVLREQ